MESMVYLLADAAVILNRHYTWVNEQSKLAAKSEPFRGVRLRDHAISQRGWLVDLNLFLGWLQETNPEEWSGFDLAGGVRRLEILRTKVTKLDKQHHNLPELPPTGSPQGSPQQKLQPTNTITPPNALEAKLNEIQSGMTALAKRDRGELIRKLRLELTPEIEADIRRGYRWWFRCLGAALAFTGGAVGLVGWYLSEARTLARQRMDMITDQRGQIVALGGDLEETKARLESTRGEVGQWQQRAFDLTDERAKLLTEQAAAVGRIAALERLGDEQKSQIENLEKNLALERAKSYDPNQDENNLTPHEYQSPGSRPETTQENRADEL